ncbi:MotA/TolQ/ExbB proton channel family protein [Marinibaculum pumilum]|uniref:MotA/TolQ/ExbB proton channel family protein n=1 Tax=Marinibaculum pumilum TaxID=1766165 RepID=A0ABV7L8N1_9PROT
MDEEQVAVELPGNGQGVAADANGTAPADGTAVGAAPADGAQIGGTPADGSLADGSLAGAAPDGNMAGTMMAGDMTPGEGPIAQIAEWAGLGGPVVWILAAMSVLALAVTIMKIVQFLRGGVWRRGRAARAVAAFRAGDDETAADLLRGRGGLPVQVVRASLRATAAHGPLPALREEIEQFASDRLEGLRGNLRFLEAIAALAPLLGLFGTVLGMIAAFQDMQGAGARVSPDILAGGIWTALLTTAVGLAVAMPAVALVTWFERTLDSLAHDLESYITQIFAARAVAELEPANEEAHVGRRYAVARAG